MGDDAIGALEITNVQIQGLRGRIMVSVCSGKAALAEVMGLSDVERALRFHSGQAQVQRAEADICIFHFSSGHLIGNFYWAPMRDSGECLKITLLLSSPQSFSPAGKQRLCCGSPLPGWQ